MLKELISKCQDGSLMWTQNKLLTMMIRSMMECENRVVDELLHILLTQFGICTLSIIKVADRSVVVSTEDDEMQDEVGKMAQSIKDVCKNRYYLRNQKNNVWFREGYNCIRTVPLMYENHIKYVLVIEQEENEYTLTDSVLGVLAIAVYLEMMERDIMDSYYKDGLTGLPNRDSLIRYMEQSEDITYVGMFYLRNANDILFCSNYQGLDALAKMSAGIIGNVYPKGLFRVGEDKFAVCLSSGLYESVSSMQDCMDLIIKSHPEAFFSASLVSVKLSKELYQILYACENACRKAAKDMVMVVRCMDDVEDKAYEEEVYVGGTYKEKEVINVDAQEVKAYKKEKDVTEKENKGTVESSVEDLEFFYKIPEEESILNHI